MFVESFQPYMSFEKSEDSRESLIYRIAVVGLIVGFGYWVYTQPTELDEMLVIQRKFVEDLYAGNLLSDTSQEAKKDIDRIIPDLEELQRALDEDDEELDESMERMMEDDEQANRD